MKKYPEGHFMGQGIAVGMLIYSGLGISMSIILDNPGLIPIGMPIGVAIGIAIGQHWEKKAKAEGKIRPLNKEEKKRKKYAVYFGIGALIVGIIILSKLTL